MKRIVTVDSQSLVREGLRALLERERDFEVVGEGCEGQEAVKLARRLKPDVLLLDLVLPGLHGLEVLRSLQDQEVIKSIVVTAHSNSSYVLEALKIGAAGYILKSNTFAELAQAIRCVGRGEHYLSKELRNCALQLTIGRHSRNGKNGENRLTTRERVVLELVAEGHSNAQIAERLLISRRTVESHRASLMQKLRFRTQTDLVRYAIRHQIITA